MHLFLPKNLPSLCTILWIAISSSSAFSPARTPSRCRRRTAAAPAAPAGGDRPASHPVKLTFEGASCTIFVEEHETILAAMERADVARRLALADVPFDCRRGNCLTCTARHRGGNKSVLVRGEDGLAPSVSHAIRSRGFVLTCSSKVVGDGVHLELGANHDAWSDVYDVGKDEHAMRLGRAVAAKVIRKSDERNRPRWERETERALEKSGDSPDGS